MAALRAAVLLALAALVAQARLGDKDDGGAETEEQALLGDKDEGGAETEEQELAAISDEELAEVKELQAQGVQRILTEPYLQKLHGRMDKDRDGKVTAEEAEEFADHVFSNLGEQADVRDILYEVDTSGDSLVSLEEHLADAARQAWDPKTEKRKFALADTNGDQMLDTSELKTLITPAMGSDIMLLEMEEQIKGMDANHDGKLSKDEWIQDALKDHEDVEGEAAGAETKREMNEAFGRLDKNKDSFLQPAELAVWEMGKYHLDKHLAEVVAIADEDHDGQVTEEELVQARDKIASLEASGRMLDLVELSEGKDL